MRNESGSGRALAAWLLAALVAASTPGCTSPLSAVSLRDFLVDSTAVLQYERDAETQEGRSKKAGTDSLSAQDSRDGDESAGPDEESEAQAEPEEPIEQAIERALDRLAKSRGLDQLARDLLVETLEKSNPSDWPAIIDSFAASLETSAAAASTDDKLAVDTPSPVPVKPVGGLTSPVTASLPAGAAAAPADATPAATPDKEKTHDVEESLEVKVAAAVQEIPCEQPTGRTEQEIVAALEKALADARRQAPLAVRRICFASRVRGWGSIDRFEESRFEPEQNVLVYMELENLVGTDEAKGIATRVATRFRLVDAAGESIEEWSFPEIEDVSESPRTDYFVRYFLTMPRKAPAGPCRLECVVTDAVAAKTAEAELSLEIVGK